MEWATAVSVFAIGGPFGAMLAGAVCNQKGRRAAITTNAGLYVYEGVLVALAPSMMWLIPARNLIGFACGLENIYLVRVFTFLFIFVSSHSPLFLLLFLVIFFYNFKF